MLALWGLPFRRTRSSEYINLTLHHFSFPSLPMPTPSPQRGRGFGAASSKEVNQEIKQTQVDHCSNQVVFTGEKRASAELF
ncbi:MAG: hypothetical protein Fur0021_30910 [Candidatus Promineifilaceae bacterium]